MGCDSKINETDFDFKLKQIRATNKRFMTDMILFMFDSCLGDIEEIDACKEDLIEMINNIADTQKNNIRRRL